MRGLTITCTGRRNCASGPVFSRWLRRVKWTNSVHRPTSILEPGHARDHCCSSCGRVDQGPSLLSERIARFLNRFRTVADNVCIGPRRQHLAGRGVTGPPLRALNKRNRERADVLGRSKRSGPAGRLIDRRPMPQAETTDGGPRRRSVTSTVVLPLTPAGGPTPVAEFGSVAGSRVDC